MGSLTPKLTSLRETRFSKATQKLRYASLAQELDLSESQFGLLHVVTETPTLTSVRARTLRPTPEKAKGHMLGRGALGILKHPAVIPSLPVAREPPGWCPWTPDGAETKERPGLGCPLSVTSARAWLFGS